MGLFGNGEKTKALAESEYQQGVKIYDGGDVKEALIHFKAAAKKGHVDAQYRLGLHYYETNLAKALKWFEKAAKQNHSEAMYMCGKVHFEAGGENDIPALTVSLYYYGQAAELGNLKAQIDCAKRYLEGKGADVDKSKALYWYEKAAELGDSNAQFICGRMYADGEGTETDKAKALYWYEKASENGNDSAMFGPAVWHILMAREQRRIWTKQESG